MANNRRKNKRKKSVVVQLPFWAVVTLIIVGVVVFAIWYLFIYDKPKDENIESSSTVETSKEETPISVNGDVQIYSIEMHDKYGDSLFIKYNDYDILIDAGDDGDGEYVRDFVDSHISDDKNLDLLVVTHCHSDHMGGLTIMSDSDKEAKALDNVSTISNIIDFGHKRSKNTMYNTYNTLRQSFIDKGTKYYPAYETAKQLNGLSNTINFGDLKVEVLDTFNYATQDTDLIDAEYNDYSVATLFTYKTTKLFCAGDLEDVGEKTLIEHAHETSLKDVKDSDTVIYKACHHGTDVGSANNKSTGATSTNGGNRMALLQLLNPDYCFVSSAITQSDHPFPRAIATMLYFTENVYFNGTMGTICFDLDGTNVGVQGLGATSNYTLSGHEIDYESEKNLRYTETVWYNNHIFEGAHSWYKGDIANPTDKELTEWYLNKLYEDYPK